MTRILSALAMALDDGDRARLAGAFASDAELAGGVDQLLDGLPRDVQRMIVRRLAAHLERLPLSGGALIVAVADALAAHAAAQRATSGGHRGQGQVRSAGGGSVGGRGGPVSRC